MYEATSERDFLTDPVVDRTKFAEAVSLASSVIAKIQQPDPSETGLLDSPPKPRHRNYNILASDYTYVVFL